MKIKGISPILQEQAREALMNKNATSFLLLVGHEQRGNLLIDNTELLLRLGIFEQAFYDTFTHGPYWPAKRWLIGLGFCDRKKLSEKSSPRGF